jgi:hypothetical protein
MGVTSSNFSSNHSDMGLPPNRSVCHQFELQTDKLETFVSPIPDQKAWAVDAMTISWKGIFNYIFPPLRLLYNNKLEVTHPSPSSVFLVCFGLEK